MKSKGGLCSKYVGHMVIISCVLYIQNNIIEELNQHCPNVIKSLLVSKSRNVLTIKLPHNCKIVNLIQDITTKHNETKFNFKFNFCQDRVVQ